MAKKPTKKGATKAPTTTGRNRTPIFEPHGEWTTARFWSFIRSALRSKTMRWKPFQDAKLKARRKYEGPNKRQKFEYQCADCGEWFPNKEIQVDHIVPCGSLKDFSDLPGFVERLFCGVEGLRALCSDCHLKRTNEEREAKKSVDTEDEES